ncbi:MAG: Radical domain protein [Herbinix sp.]|jgi:uncharacterized radical SAM protein YgiQ|nr:Radical domain protein [Herbinix sp.]
MIKDYLPISKEDMEQRGWEQCDFVFITGDAYVDHPSFGPAIISRILESNGYKVGIIAQPDWKDNNSITVLGTPRLGFLVSGGNMDTMVNHYSVAKKKRQTDAYSPGGEMGKRPDYATVVYCNLIRKVYKEVPIIIGGIEASLRRLAHYDYWSDKVKRSILLDSQADLISYGMGEHSIVEIADALQSGIEIKDITFINGTVFKAKNLDSVYDAQMLPSFQRILESKEEFARSFYIQYINTDPYTGRRLVEQYSEHEYVVQNPPSKPLTQAEMDRVYALPYMRDYHPSYIEKGGIPAIEEVKFSLISNRGCFGGCNYCALTFHQGRILQTRSHESIVAEASQLVWDKDFKGYIHDVGGPTANFRHVACEKQNAKGACVNKQCLYPTPCKSLKIDHQDYLALLRKLRNLPNVKKVFIRSGVRYDYLVKDPDETFMKEMCEHHVSGQLKVAPEHISDNVLELMGKPANSVYEEFVAKYKKVNEKMGKKQFVVPYLISSHPGSTLKEAIALAEYLRDIGYMPEQVQDFYPTPSTISTCMYYTGLDPRTMKEVYVPKSPHEKAMQRALIQYRNPKNYALVVEALTKANRTDLIGFDKKCLVRPRLLNKEKQQLAQEYKKTSVKQESRNGKQESRNVSERQENRSNYKKQDHKNASTKQGNPYSKNNQFEKNKITADKGLNRYGSDKSQGKYTSDKGQIKYGTDKNQSKYASDKGQIKYGSDKTQGKYTSDKSSNKYGTDKGQNKFDGKKLRSEGKANRNESLNHNSDFIKSSGNNKQKSTQNKNHTKSSKK